MNSLFNIKISKADRLFSIFIRDRAGWSCERCFRKFEPPTQILQCSHFYGRIGKSTRWDPDNAAALCVGCHQYFSSHPVEHREFFLKKLGVIAYDALVVRAHLPTKVDEKLMALYWEQRLKELGVKTKWPKQQVKDY